MLTYLIKRVLIIIPTFIGVSMMIWLVMTLAPGEPDAPGAGGQDSSELSSMESKNKNVRMFRRQYYLDRPRFWNNWTTLKEEDVLEAIKRAGKPADGPEESKAKLKAVRSLDDWQMFAVRPLVSLLSSTANDPSLQNDVLRYLRQSAYSYRPTYAAGYTPTEEERAQEKANDEQNRLIDTDAYKWSRDADGEKRAAVVATWKDWYQKNRAKYEFEGWEKFKIGIGDTQFGKYWSNMFHFDFGKSTVTKEPVLDMIVSRFKYSLSLAVPAFLIAWILAIFLGVFGATHHGSKADQTLGVGLFMLYSIPAFVAATVLQQLLAVDHRIFPVKGFESANAATNLTTWEHLKDVLWHITLPLICYSYGGLAYISRQARSGMLQVLRADYIRTARAKGLKERTVVWKHGVRNGMMPIVTLLGTALPVLVAGSVFIETVFNIDGFGRLMIQSIFQRDYNVVMGIQLIVAMLTLVGLLLTDLIYASMDPRISFK